jgi:3-methylcrotonyl-CoA carboxylase beta subunit
VNAMSNSIVPKITIIVGGSFGAGNYALCGKAYDPTFIFAWPSAKYAVMGADQAAGTLFTVQKQAAERAGIELDEDELKTLHDKVRDGYQDKADIRYAAARGWIDGVIAPHRTREVLLHCLRLVTRPRPEGAYRTGVFQV